MILAVGANDAVCFWARAPGSRPFWGANLGSWQKAHYFFGSACGCGCG